jgi:hypothetical protein
MAPPEFGNLNLLVVHIYESAKDTPGACQAVIPNKQFCRMPKCGVDITRYELLFYTAVAWVVPIRSQASEVETTCLLTAEAGQAGQSPEALGV